MLANKELCVNEDFVGIAFSGEVDSAKATAIARQYVRLAYDYPKHNILVDLRDISASISLVDCMEVAQVVADCFAHFRNKVAHLIHDDNERVRVAKQLESCMVLKGFTYKVFTDSEAATGWLSESA